MSERSPYSRAPLSIDVAGRTVTVPYAPAAVWIEALLAGGGTPALLVALTDDATGDRIMSGMLGGDIPMRGIQQASYDLLAVAAPYKWWKTAKLLSSAGRDDLAGHLLLSGVDPWRHSVAEISCAVYALLTKGTDRSSRFKIDAEIDDPPPGIVDDDWMSEDDFEAMVADARNSPGQK